VARTTRICSLALLLASVAAPVGATRSSASALELYARARTGGGADAVRAYCAALTAAPDEPTVALRAYRQAVTGGDYALALRSVQVLERTGFLTADARLFLYVSALRDRDWKTASVRLAAVARDAEFAFMVPILADWLTLSGDGGPTATSVRKLLRGGDAYAQENRALLMLAQGDGVGGSSAVKTLWLLDPYRAQSLRLTAAATLAARGQRELATELLVADDLSTKTARVRIAKRKSLQIGISNPAGGAAFLLSRMAGDLITQGSGRAAITFARFAQFADPENPRVALIAAGALAIGGDDDKAAALVLADRVIKDPVYGNDAASLRIDLLEQLGEVEQAVAKARARSDNSINDLARVGDIEARRGNYAEAAAVFRRVLDLSPDRQTSAALFFATGNALNQAGDWKAARPYLERALTLTPGNSALLNELGYGLIENNEGHERAIGFLDAAAAIKPDSAAIMDSIGWANYLAGNNDLAIAHLEKAVELDNGEAEIGEHLGDAYWRGGRHVAARYSWAAARIQAEGEMVARLDQKIERGLP
jgi:tetratricopeptide (TPR) repeat protein